MQYLALFSIPCQVFILLTTRGHYTIDLIAGGIIAHYMHIMTNHYIKPVDRKYIGLDADNEEAEAELESDFEDFVESKAKGLNEDVELERYSEP